MWHQPRIKDYAIDVINFNTGFRDCYNFQMLWNPVHPIAVYKYGCELWLTLLPGKYKNAQGAILYRLQVANNNATYFETCQWSPDGNILLMLRKTSVVATVRQPYTEYIKVGFILIQKIRENYSARQLKGGWDLLPTCWDLTQLSSK